MPICVGSSLSADRRPLSRADDSWKQWATSLHANIYVMRSNFTRLKSTESLAARWLRFSRHVISDASNSATSRRRRSRQCQDADVLMLRCCHDNAIAVRQTTNVFQLSVIERNKTDTVIHSAKWSGHNDFTVLPALFP